MTPKTAILKHLTELSNSLDDSGLHQTADEIDTLARDVWQKPEDEFTLTPPPTVELESPKDYNEMSLDELQQHLNYIKPLFSRKNETAAVEQALKLVEYAEDAFYKANRLLKKYQIKVKISGGGKELTIN